MEHKNFIVFHQQKKKKSQLKGLTLHQLQEALKMMCNISLLGFSFHHTMCTIRSCIWWLLVPCKFRQVTSTEKSGENIVGTINLNLRHVQSTIPILHHLRGSGITIFATGSLTICRRNLLKMDSATTKIEWKKPLLLLFRYSMRNNAVHNDQPRCYAGQVHLKDLRQWNTELKIVPEPGVGISNRFALGAEGVRDVRPDWTGQESESESFHIKDCKKSYSYWGHFISILTMLNW